MQTTINQLQAPMEMLGVHQGITVIDPATILTRLWYFDGKFLRAEGFRTDQQYVRSLVALSNQAAGHGVVHGFDVRLGSGDTIDVDGGLGIAPSGRVVYLPQGTGLDVATLIARASGDFNPAVAGAAGTADFGLCPADTPTGPDQSLSPNTIWVLTVAAAEALCGEEERFGQLCEDACATETDRSVAVEGVCFRVRPLLLTLPKSTKVPFDGSHHRSRVASAYFEAERHAVASGISGAGIRSTLWCHGAEGVGGEELALGVFSRAGAVTSWLDMWTARREVMETNPQRYWGRRFAMRPLDVFLAQVLQFQCQLLALGTDTPGGGGDPCADERLALETASATLAALLAPPSPDPGEIIADVVGPPNVIPTLAAAQLTQLNVLIANALTGKVKSPSGSALIDGGIVELPSGGYLPVDPDQDVTAQVRAYMGPGVDLRFCAVRPDFIPEALQEAQHMDRISLTQGIDDPDALEEVDILVPGGRFEQAQIETSAFEGEVRVLPNLQGENEPLFNVPVFAREHTGTSWSWTSVAYLGIGDDFEPGNVFTVVGGRELLGAGEGEGEPAAEKEEVEAALLRLRTPEAGPRPFVVETERRVVLGRQRLARNLLAERTARRLRVEGFDPIDVAETVRIRQPVAGANAFVRETPAGTGAAYGWLDFSIDADLRTVTPGTRVPVTVQAIGYVNAVKSELFADFTLNGGLTVTSVQPAQGTAGVTGTKVVTMLDGGVDYLIDRAGNIDSGFESGGGIELEWLAGTSNGKSVMRIAAVRNTNSPRGDGSILAEFESSGVNRLIVGSLSVLGPAVTHLDRTQLADLTLTENDGVLDPGTIGRDLGESLIAVLTAELDERQRGGAFATRAPQRLFASSGVGGTSALAAATDWVMFHRRRTKVCSDAATVAPTRLRRFRWFHTAVSDAAEQKAVLAGLDPNASAAERARAFQQAKFVLVSEVEFAEGSAELHTQAPVLRLAWQNATNSTKIVAGVVAEPAAGEGPALGRSRIRNTMGAVSNLADSTGALIEWLTPVPPEHQAAGTDGVFYTFGTRQKKTVSAGLLVRLPVQLNDRLAAIDGTFDLERLKALLEELGTDFDSTIVQFVDGALANADEIRNWWGIDRPVETAMVGFTTAVPAQNEALRKEWVTSRTEAVTSTVGFGAIGAQPLDNLSFSVADVEAVLFLSPGG